ncbi:Alpha/Beta hydrolase protein [Biscogniauxia mediterranea]|nr:Alpha/Beta hydrolase protein [Biscogniauxia mediterranea]
MLLRLRSAYALSSRHLSPLAIAPSSFSTTSRINTLALTCRTYSRLFDGLLLAPVVFGGLFVSLWTWKCFMMVLFQNKIIYMPGLPPNARWEKIQDYENRLAGMQWREERIRARDGTDLALAITDIDLGQSRTSTCPDAVFYILYFQGNASSLPPRLPDLSSVLCTLKRRALQEPKHVRCTMICLSYRGYWTSRGRPTEKGIRLDAAAAVDCISNLHQKTYGDRGASSPPAELVLWGQSIGSGVATNLASEYCMPENLHLNALILETPFTSIRAMLEVLYPQKWLPYRHLWPFLRNHLDSWQNLELISKKYKPKGNLPAVFILHADRDELVPAELTDKLYDRCLEVQLPVTRKAVSGAFHNDTMFRAEGRKSVSDFLLQRMRV